MELKLHHVNYSTKDVGAVAEFYRSLFNMKPVPSYGDAQITSQGYDRKVEFLTDGTTEFHIAFADYGVWAIGGWYQIFLQDPDGTIVEVHQTDYKEPGV